MTVLCVICLLAGTAGDVGPSEVPPSVQAAVGLLGATAATPARDGDESGNDHDAGGATIEPEDEQHRETRGSPLTVRAAGYFSENLHQAELAHLTRVAVWGSGSLVGGAALMGGSAGLTYAGIDSQPELFGLGFQSALWGAINVGLAGAGAGVLLGGFAHAVTDNLHDAMDNEDTWRNIILVNEVLNVGYILVGAALVVAGFFPIPLAAQFRGHGFGIVLQGFGLLVLDGVALYESFGRKEKVDRFRSVPAHKGALGE